MTYTNSLDKGERQCIYCGRFMTDRKAIHRVRDQPWSIHACEICHKLLELTDASTVEGRQRFISRIMSWQKPNEMQVRDQTYRTYVGRRGRLTFELRPSQRDVE